MLFAFVDFIQEFDPHTLNWHFNPEFVTPKPLKMIRFLTITYFLSKL